MDYSWRERIYGPVVTLLCCLQKQLVTGSSARIIEDQLASLGIRFRGDRDGRDFCAARARLPLPVFKRACTHLGRRAAGVARRWRDLRVVFVDGTTLRAPRTSKNIASFRRSNACSRKSILPIVRLLCLVCAQTGAVLNFEIGAWLTGEARLFLRLIKHLGAGQVVIGDRAFCSYLNFYLLTQRGCHIISRQHVTRRTRCVLRQGRQDEIHEWTRPDPSDSAFPKMLAQAPRRMYVRTITRTIRRQDAKPWTVTVCTTLLDARKYPADEIVKLYLERWNIESDFRVLKETLKLNRLTGNSPDIVRKEICAGILAYNLVRITMALAGHVRRLSFVRSLHLLLSFSAWMAYAPTIRQPALFDELLRLVSECVTQLQLRPSQPRAILQHPTCYPTLRVSRNCWLKTGTLA
jgi:hypothetical protein